MDDKKNDDYVVRMPEGGGYASEEKEPFMAKASPRRSHNVSPPALVQSVSRLDNNPPLSVVAYCLSSISMTVVNKYVVSGTFWNLNFFYLAVQVCRDVEDAPEYSTSC